MQNLRRRDLLTAAAALPLVGLGTRSAAGPVAPAVNPQARRLIVIVSSGGWDSGYCFDPKLGVEGIDDPSLDSDPTDPTDLEEIGSFSGIPIEINNGRRPAVTEFFEAWASRSCVVNGIWLGAVSHVANMRRILTGTTVEGHADFATIASTALAPELAVGNLDLLGVSLPGPFPSRLIRIGANAQLRTLLGSDAAYEPPSFVVDATQGAAVAEFRASRLAALRAARGGAPPNDATLDGLADSVARRPGLDAMAESLDLVGLSQSPGTYTYELDLAADLFRRDVCRVVTMASYQGWDTHADNSLQSGHFNALFGGLSRFVDTLQASGMLDTTTIALVSEMSRSPLQNELGGKDHWPVTSAMLIGGGVAGGRVIGATDSRAEPLPVDGEIKDYSHFVAGVLQVVGIDPEEWLPGVVPLELRA